MSKRSGKFSYEAKPMHRVTVWRRQRAKMHNERLRLAREKALLDAQRLKHAAATVHASPAGAALVAIPTEVQDERPIDNNFREMISTTDCSTEEVINFPEDEPQTQVEMEVDVSVSDTDETEQTASKFSVVEKFKLTLCDCTKVTCDDVVLMVVATGMRHRLTWLAQLDILKIIQAIFPKQNIPLSKYRLFKRTESDNPVIRQYHVFCPDCEAYLEPSNNLDKIVICQFCEAKIEVTKAANYFCTLSLRDQLRDLFQGPADLGQQMMDYRVNRKKKIESNLENIFDGSMYKEQCKPSCILSDPKNFSYNFFTDGVPMGHSGKSIWPIYLMINELPDKVKRKYIILGGLYIGPREPNLNVYLKPFVEEANKLSGEGFSWSLNGVDVISKGIPMCAVADSPARAKLLNMQGHIANWGCTYCYHYKSRTNTSNRRKYLITVGVAARTVESTDEDVRIAFTKQHLPEKKDRQHRGVYGPSSIAKLNYFDITKNAPVDYMHCLLLGAVRSHTNLLLDSDGKKIYWNLDAQPWETKMKDIIDIIDKRLLKIKPPKSITRPPQPLLKRSGWKASEWRSWILFYCIVCLQGLLKEKYLVHLAKLSAAIFILLQDSVSVKEVNEAHALLTSYQCDYQEYFGQSSMVYNIHLLRHVCEGVLRFGPIWTHSSFPYEGENRHMLQLQTSPYSVVKQISKRYLLNMSFPDLCASLTVNENIVEFCEDVLSRHLKVYVYSSGCYLLGKGQQVKFTEEECVALNSFSNCGTDGFVFKRMLVKGFRVYALGYTTVTETKTKNMDNYVFVEEVGCCVVEKIVLNTNSTVLVLVRPVILLAQPIVSDEGKNIKFDHVKQVHMFSDLRCIYASQISSQCVMVDLQMQKYVCKFPYGCYRD